MVAAIQIEDDTQMAIIDYSYDKLCVVEWVE